MKQLKDKTYEVHNRRNKIAYFTPRLGPSSMKQKMPFSCSIINTSSLLFVLNLEIGC